MEFIRAGPQMPTTKNIERQMVSVGDPISQKNSICGFTGPLPVNSYERGSLLSYRTNNLENKFLGYFKFKDFVKSIHIYTVNQNRHLWLKIKSLLFFLEFLKWIATSNSMIA